MHKQYPVACDVWVKFDILLVIAAGSDAKVRFTFEGDEVFEMEDQRQWLDGSYKTYFRKLSQTPLP